MPKVTVLMAVYNGELYLREAIDSILVQALQDFELLIINDGSTDSTREIICSYNDSRIRLIDNNYNLGLTRSLNKGLKLAEGEFIARQDADDISEPERLAKQVSFMERNPEVALVGTWYKQIDSKGNLICKCELPYDCTQIRWSLLFYSPFIHSTVMFRKSAVLEHIGFYNEVAIYAQDYEFWCRIALRLKIANLSDYLIKWRVHSSSVTATYGNIQQDTALHIQINNIGYLLGWEEAKRWSNGIYLKAMTSLWLGELEKLKDLNLQQINQVIEETFHLHHAFCNYYNLNQQESKKHLNEVLSHLSYQLLKLTHYYLKKNKYTALHLFNRAGSLKLFILLNRITMNFPKKYKNWLNLIYKHYNFQLLRNLFLNHQQNPEIEKANYHTSLPSCAESYLQPNNERLKDLKSKYSQVDSAVVKSLNWTDDYIKPDELKYFRGDNGFIWQLLDGNLEINYVLTTYYIKTIDCLHLLDKLEEDNQFGVLTYSVDDKIVSRDLLDSILEIYFLEKELNISKLPNLNILDIGAGYGRLAHRMTKALPNINNYFCTDAVPVSTFICEYYIRFRSLQEKAKVIPLYEVENTLLTQPIDLAINVHSFSECTISAIKWWMNILRKIQVRYIMIVPNVIKDGGLELLTNYGQDFLPILEMQGYKLIAKSPKYRDVNVQKYGLSPTFYYLFEML